jgi:phosphocarrier protein HPr
MATKVTQEFTVENENGFHARPTASFVKKANEFQSHIEVVNEDGQIADGKSIMGLLCLAAGPGAKLKITAEGKDANEAIYAFQTLFKTKFGEGK